MTATFTGTVNSSSNTESATSTTAATTRPRLHLRSHKMAGLKDLLLAEKLNTHAISLQLTAQSQVQLGGRKLRDQDVKIDTNKTSDGKEAYNGARGDATRPKRNRKE